MVTDRWFAARRRLYELLHMHPEWSNRQYAAALNASVDWVCKWKARIGWPPHPDPDLVCQSQSRARKTPPLAWSESVIQRILALRHELVALFHRTVVSASTICPLNASQEVA